METKLKVGDSFEVVEVISSEYENNPFKIGGHTLKMSVINHILINGNINYGGYFKEYLGQKTLCLLYKHTKPIGKLTITKIK